jgi:hypothetical protein
MSVDKRALRRAVLGVGGIVAATLAVIGLVAWLVSVGTTGAIILSLVFLGGLVCLAYYAEKGHR